MKKNPNNDLKKYHLLFTEIGLICSLLFFIAATNIHFSAEEKAPHFIPDIENFKTVEIPPTNIPKKLPPQKPMVFTEKPDDVIIDAEIPEFPDFGDFNQRILYTPEAPPEEEEKIVGFLPVMPSIIGGQKNLYSKIVYPEIPKRAGIEGRVTVQFIVDKNGQVNSPKIIRSVHPELDKELLRVIELVRFSPGVQNGVLVKVRMTQTVNFQLKR
jgi:protein TonB